MSNADDDERDRIEYDSCGDHHHYHKHAATKSRTRTAAAEASKDLGWDAFVRTRLDKVESEINVVNAGTARMKAIIPLMHCTTHLPCVHSG